MRKASRSWVRRRWLCRLVRRRSGWLHDGIHPWNGGHGLRHVPRRPGRTELRMIGHPAGVRRALGALAAMFFSPRHRPCRRAERSSAASW